jgi:hypothetical protein
MAGSMWLWTERQLRSGYGAAIKKTQHWVAMPEHKGDESG